MTPPPANERVAHDGFRPSDLQQIIDGQTRIEDAVSKLSRIVTGDGDPEKGMIIRIDRLERESIESKRIARGLVDREGLELKKVKGAVFAWVVGPVITIFVLIALIIIAKFIALHGLPFDA